MFRMLTEIKGRKLQASFSTQMHFKEKSATQCSTRMGKVDINKKGWFLILGSDMLNNHSGFLFSFPIIVSRRSKTGSTQVGSTGTAFELLISVYLESF